TVGVKRYFPQAEIVTTAAAAAARSAMTTGDERREARMRHLRCRDCAASRFVQESSYAPPKLPVWRDHDTQHRIAALAQVKPEPNAVRTRRPARARRPSANASSRAIGLDAAVVVPC